MNEVKPGDVISEWGMVTPYVCTGSVSPSQNGDNPNVDASCPPHLGGGPDVIQNHSHGGADPTPSMPGA